MVCFISFSLISAKNLSNSERQVVRQVQATFVVDRRFQSDGRFGKYLRITYPAFEIILCEVHRHFSCGAYRKGSGKDARL